MLGAMALSARRQLERTLAVLDPVWDVVEGRLVEATPPSWCERRGWSDYLLALTDQELVEAERHGLERALPRLPPAPASLHQLVVNVDELVEPFRYAGGSAPPSPRAHLSPRKLRQVEALLAAAVASFSAARRIVEVGAGRGHATRALAGRLEVPALGVERDPVLVRRAHELAEHRGVSFVVADGRTALDLVSGDLAVGLHACGELGDALVCQAAAARAHVLLVSCCLQKVAGDARAPLSDTARLAGLRCGRSILGLSNVASFSEIGHAEVVTRGRQARHALRMLLAARGHEVAPGEEARRIHRRAFRGGLEAVASRALALRGLPPPTREELARFSAAGGREYRRMRRLSLPRAMLGRVIELSVVLDRAAYLEDHGHAVRVEPLFPQSVSPRNLAILATAPS
jgi:SAM-dependent methyltransferase